MGNIVMAPWTEEQTECLNNYQNAGVVHPFTCPNDECGDVLVAKKSGWLCPSCGRTQNWAHEFMTTWRKEDTFELLMKFNQGEK